MRERYAPDARLFAQAVATNIGVLHEPGHPEPWIIAMECTPTRAAVLDYAARWVIEPTFSDFKSRGFDLEDSRLEHADRLERLILIMALAMYWCASSRRCLASPNASRKNTHAQTDSNHWSFRKLYRSFVSWFKQELRRLKRCLQNELPLPLFHEIMKN